MKSSSISLLYVPGAALLPQGPNSCSLADKKEKGSASQTLVISLISTQNTEHPLLKHIGTQSPLFAVTQ